MELIGHLTSLGTSPVLHLDGEIDLSTVPQLHDHLARAMSLHIGHTLFVDLDGVAALDDTGLGVLLGAAGRCREQNGELVLVCTAERLIARFRITGLDRAIQVVARIGSPVLTD